jgi:hypothetical protein
VLPGLADMPGQPLGKLGTGKTTTLIPEESDDDMWVSRRVNSLNPYMRQ